MQGTVHANITVKPLQTFNRRYTRQVIPVVMVRIQEIISTPLTMGSMAFAPATFVPPSIPHTNQMTNFSPRLCTIPFPNPKFLTLNLTSNPIATLNPTLHLRWKKPEAIVARANVVSPEDGLILL